MGLASTLVCDSPIKALCLSFGPRAVYPRPGRRQKRYDLAERSKRVDSKKFPLAAAAGEHTFADFDKHLEQGLRIIIKGLSAGL
jgi:hypothetical protein